MDVMRNIFCILLLSGVSLYLASCRMELEPYNETVDRVAFYFDPESEGEEKYTFAYYPDNVRVDTIEVEVQLYGNLSSQPRKVNIVQQEVDGVDNAKPGIHYVPFSELSSSYIIVANETNVKLPIVFKRDTSLREKERVLEIRLTEEGSDFKLGASDRIVKRLVISDILLKPTTWEGAADWYLNGYGLEKHRLMINAAAPYGVLINDDWVESVMNGGDMGYINYWISIFKEELQRVNDERASAGQGPLKEGIEYGGEIVSFDMY